MQLLDFPGKPWGNGSHKPVTNRRLWDHTFTVRIGETGGEEGNVQQEIGPVAVFLFGWQMSRPADVPPVKRHVVDTKIWL